MGDGPPGQVFQISKDGNKLIYIPYSPSCASKHRTSGFSDLPNDEFRMKFKKASQRRIQTNNVKSPLLGRPVPGKKLAFPPFKADTTKRNSLEKDPSSKNLKYDFSNTKRYASNPRSVNGCIELKKAGAIPDT